VVSGLAPSLRHRPGYLLSVGPRVVHQADVTGSTVQWAVTVRCMDIFKGIVLRKLDAFYMETGVKGHRQAATRFQKL